MIVVNPKVDRISWNVHNIELRKKFNWYKLINITMIDKATLILISCKSKFILDCQVYYTNL